MIGHLTDLLQSARCLFEREIVFLNVARKLIDLDDAVELTTVDRDMLDVGIALSGGEDTVAEYKEMLGIDAIMR